METRRARWTQSNVGFISAIFAPPRFSLRFATCIQSHNRSYGSISGKDAEHNLNVLMAHIQPAIPCRISGCGTKSTSPGCTVADVVKANAENTAKKFRKLVCGTPDRKKKVADRKIIPAYYELLSGKMKFNPWIESCHAGNDSHSDPASRAVSDF